MATQTEVQIKLTVDGSQPEKSVGSIKTQLKEANAELLAMREKFGDTSDEAVAAAKKVGKLKDSIGDAKAMADAFSPDQKFKAFGQALQGVAGGFAAVQGAMGLMGSESKDVEKMLLKVNSAMALSQGIDSVLNSADAFKTLGKKLMSFSVIQNIVTVAQRLFNLAMAANPIGVLITAITLLIAGVAALTSYFMSNAKAAKANEKAVKENAKALEQQQKATAKAADELNRAQNFQLAMAKANGATTASIRALELKLIDEKIATQQASRETAINTFEKNKNALASLKQAGASDEVIKKQKETTDESLKFANEQTAILNKSNIDRQELTRKHTVEIATEQKTANNDANQKSKQDAETAKQNKIKANQERKELDKNFASELKTADDENFLNSIKDDNKRAVLKLFNDLENEQKAIKSKGYTKEQEAALLLQLKKKFDLDLTNLNAEQKAKEDAINAAEQQKKQEEAKAILEREIAFDEATFKIKNELRISKIKDENQRARENELLNYQAQTDANLEALNNKEITQAEYDERAAANKLVYESKITSIEQSEADKKVAIAQAERDAKIATYESLANSLNQLSELVGKNTEAGKAFAITSLIIEQAVAVSKIITNTKVANAKALALFPTTLGQPYVAINTISAGFGIAASIGAVVKGIRAIRSANGKSGGAGGGAPSLAGGGGGTVAPPLPPQLNTQMINGAQVNQLASATARAYVVESDVSGNQERIQRLNRAARIN